MHLIDRADKDGICYPSQVRMAKELGLSRPGVQNALGHLQDIGVVTVIEQIKGRQNGYQINRPANSVGTRPANSEGQVVDNRPANSVGTKYLTPTSDGLPRSGKALRAADDDEINQVEDRAPSATKWTTSRAGNEAAQPEPSSRIRQTAQARTEVTPVRAGWPTAVPGKPGEFTHVEHLPNGDTAFTWTEPAA